MTGRADQDLEVTVRKTTAGAPIEQGFALLLLGASGSDWVKAGPVVSSVEAEWVLRAGSTELRRQQVVGQAVVEVPRRVGGRADLGALVPALVQGLSLAIRDLNRKIVEAIDATASAAPAQRN